MRLIHLPTFWTVVVDIIAWFVIHMGVAYVMVRIPLKRFDPEGPALPQQEVGERRAHVS